MPELTEFQWQLANGLRLAAERQIAILTDRGASSLAVHNDGADINRLALAELSDFIQLLNVAHLLPDELGHA